LWDFAEFNQSPEIQLEKVSPARMATVLNQFIKRRRKQ